jgi:hypothetical protein
MKTVSMVDFRLHAEEILTCRGKPVARLEPILPESVEADDPFYSLDVLGDDAGESLTNEQIDDVLYGQ